MESSSRARMMSLRARDAATATEASAWSNRRLSARISYEECAQLQLTQALLKHMERALAAPPSGPAPQAGTRGRVSSPSGPSSPLRVAALTVVHCSSSDCTLLYI
jgi:hypothetical protein